VLNAYDDTLCHAFDGPERNLQEKQQQQQQRWAAEQERKKNQSAKHRESSFVLHQHVNDQQIPHYDAIRDEANKFVESVQFREVVSLTRPLTPEHQHMLDNRIEQKCESDQAIARCGLAASPAPFASTRSREGCRSLASLLSG